MFIKIWMLIGLMAISLDSVGQLMEQKETFTKADSLRGNINSPLRTCYDINFYRLNVRVDPAKKSLTGSNVFKFTTVNTFKTLQFDLFENLSIDSISYHGMMLNAQRSFNAVFLTFPKTMNAGQVDSFKVFYSGKPIIAERAPWDGGFVFAKHANQLDWIATACQGIGASIWWPNKDQQDDKVDSAAISISVPKGLMNVSNGRMVGQSISPDGFVRYDWKVSYPINNYCIAVNAANYTQFQTNYNGLAGNLTCDYFVLPENLTKAKVHFERDVPRMLQAFEYWFGPYPFYKDGFKLVETPYLGMEHQSGIAYGNQYLNGYLGKDLSGTGWGNKWDFIVVHESGHEWFGNHITCKDIADMWIHESFTNYSENLFVEYHYGKEAGADYVIGTRKNIANDKPIIGPYGVNKEGSGDMYYKGGNLLHTIRQLVNNDEKWRSILIGLNTTFGFKTTTTAEVVDYMCKKSEINLKPVFDQYLRYKRIPVLEIRQEGRKIMMRWSVDVKKFKMPLKLQNEEKFVYPTHKWTVLQTNGTLNNIKIDRNFYVNLKILN